MQKLYAKMISGAFWMSLQKVVERFIGTISTLILVRLLAPEDFGLMALCTVFIAGMELFTAFGFEVVLIQKQDATRVHYDTAWTLRILFGCAGGLLLVVAAPLIADFYDEPRLRLVLFALAAAFVLRSFQNIAIVDFQKHMQFNREFAFRFMVKLAGFFTTIPIAYIYRSYWALALGIVATSLASLLLSFAMKPYLPRLTLGAVREIFSFSSWLLLNNFLFFFRDRMPELLIGKWLGPRPLGLFSVAREIATVATSELSAAVNRSIFPGYAQMTQELADLRRSVLDVTATMALIALPIGAGIIATADHLVPILLGDQWLDAAPVLQWLCGYGMIAAVTSNWIYVFNALAQPQKMTWVAIVQLVLVIPAMILWMQTDGIVGAVMAFCLTGLVTVPWMFWLMQRAIELPLRSMLDAIWRPAFAAGLMTAVVVSISRVLPPVESLTNTSLALAILVAAGAFSYGLGLWSAWLLAGRPAGSVEFRLFSYARAKFNRPALPNQS